MNYLRNPTVVEAWRAAAVRDGGRLLGLLHKVWATEGRVPATHCCSCILSLSLTRTTFSPLGMPLKSYITVSATRTTRAMADGVVLGVFEPVALTAKLSLVAAHAAASFPALRRGLIEATARGTAATSATAAAAAAADILPDDAAAVAAASAAGLPVPAGTLALASALAHCLAAGLLQRALATLLAALRERRRNARDKAAARLALMGSGGGGGGSAAGPASDPVATAANAVAGAGSGGASVDVGNGGDDGRGAAFADAWGAALGAAAWALHPLRAEVVGWLSCLPYSLAAACCFASAHCHAQGYLRRTGSCGNGSSSDGNGSSSSGGRMGSSSCGHWLLPWLGCRAWYVCGAWCKAPALTLPLALLVVDVALGGPPDREQEHPELQQQQQQQQQQSKQQQQQQQLEQEQQQKHSSPSSASPSAAAMVTAVLRHGAASVARHGDLLLLAACFVRGSTAANKAHGDDDWWDKLHANQYVQASRYPRTPRIKHSTKIPTRIVLRAWYGERSGMACSFTKGWAPALQPRLEIRSTNETNGTGLRFLRSP